MARITKDICIDQGATFRLTVVWKDGTGTPVNLNGYVARMQIRRTIRSDTPVLSLTTGNGITLGGATGSVTIVATAAQTAAINIRSGVYDLELEAPDGTVTRLMEGNVTVSFEVTR